MNPNYSLRAFAKSLNMDPSTLSKIMTGKRRLGKGVSGKLVKRLGIDPAALTPEYDQLNPEEAETLCDWQDFAILEQISITGFRPTKEKLAEALGLKQSEIELSLAKLVRLNLIEIKKSGLVAEKTSGQTTNITASTSQTKKNLQKQFLEKAISSIDFDPFEERDMTTITIAVDSKKIPEARDRIKNFRREMAEFLGQGSAKDRVYNMTIALYPTSKPNQEK